jgi:HEAT repeat protein
LTAAIPLLLTLLAATPPAWRTEILSDDAQVRHPAIAKLRARGRTGLYLVQDVVEKAPNTADRAKAIRALGELGDPTAEWELRLQLKSGSLKVLSAVVEAAAKLRLQGLSRPLSELVGNPDPELCAALGGAAKSFPAIAEHAKTALESEKGDEQLAGLRVAAAAGLPLEEAVARKLTASSRPEIRLAAAQALAARDPDAAADVLSGLILGPQEAVAVETLGKLATPHALGLLQLLIDQPAHAGGALTAIAGSAAGERVLLVRRANASLPPAQGAAIDAALEAQPHTPEWLVTLLGDPDEPIAAAAAARLGAHPAGVAALLHCVESPTPIANRCATGLAGSDQASAEIARALQSRESPVRVLMVDGLANATRLPTLAVLAPLANDPAEDVRAALPAAVGRLDAPAIPLLSALAQDGQASVRKAAATQLVRLLPADQLHTFAAQAINDPAVRSAVLSETTRLTTEDALHLLIADLGTPDAHERRQAMTLLAGYHVSEATNALMDSASKDSDPTLREYALTLLGNQ